MLIHVYRFYLNQVKKLLVFTKVLIKWLLLRRPSTIRLSAQLVSHVLPSCICAPFPPPAIQTSRVSLPDLLGARHVARHALRQALTAQLAVAGPL